MENTLKVTNVLSDPTRFNIYQHIIKQHKEVSVLDIAKQFDIHPNVARLHLSKLEEINLIVSSFLKTGKGGRPSRIYKLSDEVVELNFPHRDYKLLSSIALETFAELGEPGKQALYSTGRKYGSGVIKSHQSSSKIADLSINDKITLLEDTGTMLGLYPDFNYNEDTNSVSFEIKNCPFHEVIADNHAMICNMHKFFLKGMFEALFTEVELIETNNMFQGCHNCAYVAKISIV